MMSMLHAELAFGGRYAGFAYTQRGDDGSYYPTYVATDANGAVEGEVGVYWSMFSI